MYGLSDSHWRIVLDTLVIPLQSSGAQVWVFGSRARGDHKKYSDLDILVEWKDSAFPSPRFISSLKEKLEETGLPVTVDVVEITSLAESYRPSVLKDRIFISP